MQIRSLLTFAKPFGITKTQLLIKFAPGRDIEQKDKSLAGTSNKKTNHDFLQIFPPARTSTKTSCVFSEKSKPEQNILPNLIRNSNTPKIFHQHINSNPQINQSQSGNSNTEQSSIFVVSGSITRDPLRENQGSTKGKLGLCLGRFHDRFQSTRKLRMPRGSADILKGDRYQRALCTSFGV